jgi:acyl carrier protein
LHTSILEGQSDSDTTAGDNSLSVAAETLAILRRVCTKSVEPTMEAEVVRDLGLDSIQVLELVAELEDRFDISVPLNQLPQIRTVRQMVDQILLLVEARR